MSQKITLNSNDLKTHYESVATNIFTFNIGLAYRLNFIHVTYTADATIGNRTLRVAQQDAASQSIMDIHVGVNHTAGNVRHYVFMQGIIRETAFTGDEIKISIPQDFYFPAGCKLIVDDEAGVSAGDSMVIGVNYTLIG